MQRSVFLLSLLFPTALLSQTLSANLKMGGGYLDYRENFPSKKEFERGWMELYLSLEGEWTFHPFWQLGAEWETLFGESRYRNIAGWKGKSALQFHQGEISLGFFFREDNYSFSARLGLGAFYWERKVEKSFLHEYFWLPFSLGGRFSLSLAKNWQIQLLGKGILLLFPSLTLHFHNLSSGFGTETVEYDQPGIGTLWELSLSYRIHSKGQLTLGFRYFLCFLPKSLVYNIGISPGSQGVYPEFKLEWWIPFFSFRFTW